MSLVQVCRSSFIANKPSCQCLFVVRFGGTVAFFKLASFGFEGVDVVACGRCDASAAVFRTNLIVAIIPLFFGSEVVVHGGESHVVWAKGRNALCQLEAGASSSVVEDGRTQQCRI